MQRFMFNQLVRFVLVLVVFVMSFFMGTPSAIAQIPNYRILRVKPAGLTLAQGATGNDWDHAFRYLQDAIDEAGEPQSQSNAVQIWVAGGIYRPDQGGSPPSDLRAAYFQLHKFVEWYGGFAGTEPETLAGFRSRNIIQQLTFLSGDIGTLSVESDNSYHIIKIITEVNDQAKIDGFFIGPGYSLNEGPSGGDDSQAGSAIVIRGGDYSSGCSPRIVRCVIAGNKGVRGGAVFVSGGQSTIPRFESCSFINNHAGIDGVQSGNGGAVHVPNFITFIAGEEATFAARPSFINCVFSRNFAQNSGGAVYADAAARCTFTNCTIARNIANVGGGGLHHNNTTLCGTPGSDAHVLFTSILWENDCVNCGTQPFDQLFGARYLSVCDVDGLANLPGSCSSHGSFDADPLFRNTDNADFRLTCESPCIDRAAGLSLVNFGDRNDLDQDGNTNEIVPDRIFRDRQVVINGNTSVPLDAGAFERQQIGDSCDADINNSGIVNIDDLVAVITSWGACPMPPTPCPADISPACDLNGSVDIDDLVAVITNWGLFCATGATGFAGSFTSVQDCMDAATLEFTPHTQDWDEYVQKCVAGLCAAEIIDCD